MKWSIRLALCHSLDKHLKGDFVFWIKRHLYYQIKRGEVTVTFLEGGKTISKTCSALNHPITLVGDFIEIERCFKSIASQLTPRRFLFKAPTAIVHLLENVEGGNAEAEIRAFREAALSAGAIEIFVAKSVEKLSNSQILSREFTEWDSNNC